jgi:hypothetical protein
MFTILNQCLQQSMGQTLLSEDIRSFKEDQEIISGLKSWGIIP